MKKSSALLCSLFIQLLVLSPMCSITTFAQGPRWEKLGTRMVNYNLDRDEVVVSLAEGTFNSIKLTVRRSGINLHRLIIHFANGSKQDVMVRKNIPPEGETRVIDLKGGNRGIRKVVFWYDTKDIARGRGIIELWGRH